MGLTASPINRYTVAAVQFDPLIGRVRENSERILGFLRQTATQGARLIVFPECALSGYVFADIDEARQASQPVPGPFTQALVAACRELGVYAVAGLLEDSGEEIYNSAVLCGPEGILGLYRKTHLPFLGVDKLTALGLDPYRVWETPIGRIGILICYDLRFPEPARCLALQGAEVLIVPTNWPRGSELSPEVVAPTRALENRMFVVAVNRAGEERGTSFIGKSTILDPSGRRLALAETTSETIITATIEPAQARYKRLVIDPGVFEMDTVGDRRPELYNPIVEPVRSPTP